MSRGGRNCCVPAPPRAERRTASRLPATRAQDGSSAATDETTDDDWAKGTWFASLAADRDE
jgi:hypothetical protein